ncbi:MAG: hypothetical protein ACYC9Y_07060 [Candidatus Methylomirabilia bacterium]
MGLHQDVPRGELQQRFEDFIRYFRPRTFGEVFDIDLSQRVPLWCYPWSAAACANPDRGWLAEPDEVPDIITHFCEKGVLRARIAEEYRWLEGAYESISKRGYRPCENSYVEAFELNNGNESVYVLTDGNHRVSALAALGHRDVMIRITQSVRWNGDSYRNWPRIRDGTYGVKDAMALCAVYFVGVNGFRRSERPAAILTEPPPRSAPAATGGIPGKRASAFSRVSGRLRGVRSAISSAFGRRGKVG